MQAGSSKRRFVRTRGRLQPAAPQALEVGFPAPKKVNVLDKVVGCALQQLSTEDFQCVYRLTLDGAAGKNYELSPAEHDSVTTYRALIAAECGKAGIGTLAEFDRLRAAQPTRARK